MMQDDWRFQVGQALRATESNIAAMRLGGGVGRSTSGAPGACGAGDSGALLSAPSPSMGMGTSLGGPQFIRSYTESMHQLRSQIRALGAELELERARREEETQSATRVARGECGELREVVKQLQCDNAAMRRAISDLERRPRGLSGSQAQSECAVADERGEVGPTLLASRVAELEVQLTRQQRVLDDRASRLQSLVVETVQAVVANETERMRSVAREAARDSTEELIARRTEALQTLLREDVSTVREEYGAAEAASRAADEARRGELEEIASRSAALASRVDSLAASCSALTAASAAELLAPFQDQFTQQLAAERERISNVAALVKSELAAQTKRQSADALELQHSMQLYVSQRIDLLSSSCMPREEAQRALAQHATSLNAGLAEQHAAQRKLHDQVEAHRADHSARIAHVEQVVAEVQEAVAAEAKGGEVTGLAIKRLQEEVEGVRAKQRATVSDCAALRSALDDAVTRALSFERAQAATAEAVAAESRRLDARHTEIQGRVIGMENRAEALRMRADGAEGRLYDMEQQVQAVMESSKKANHSGGRNDELAQCKSDLTRAGERLTAVDAAVARLQAQVDGRDPAATADDVAALHRRIDAVASDLTQHYAKSAVVSRMVAEEVGALRSVVDEDRVRQQEGTHGAKMELHAALRKVEERVVARLERVQRELTQERESLAGALDAVKVQLDDAVGTTRKMLSDAKQRATTEIGEHTAKLQEVTSLVADLAGRQQQTDKEQQRAIASLASSLADVCEGKISDARHVMEGQLAAAFDNLSATIAQVRSERDSSPPPQSTMPAVAADDAFADRHHSHAEFQHLTATITALQRNVNELSAVATNAQEAAQELRDSVAAVDERATSAMVDAADHKSRLQSAVASAVAAEMRGKVAPLIARVSAAEERIDAAVAAANDRGIAAPHSSGEAGSILMGSATAASTPAKARYEGQSDDDETRQLLRIFEHRVSDCEAMVQDTRAELLDGIAGASEAAKEVTHTLTQCVLAYVDALQGTGFGQDAADGALIGNPEDVFRSLVDRSRATRETLDTVWQCMAEAVDVMRRHEVTVADVIQAIVVQNDYVQTLAEACGLDPAEFALEVNGLDAGQSAVELNAVVSGAMPPTAQ